MQFWYWVLWQQLQLLVETLRLRFRKMTPQLFLVTVILMKEHWDFVEVQRAYFKRTKLALAPMDFNIYWEALRA